MNVIGALEQIRQIEAGKMQARAALGAMAAVVPCVQMTDERSRQYMAAQAMIQGWLEEMIARQDGLMTEIVREAKG